MITKTSVETVSGKFIDLACPTVDDIVASDIAWALSREPRFGGHTITAIPYSVGQHSLEVSRIVQQIFVDGPIRTSALQHFQHLQHFAHDPDSILDRQNVRPLVLYALLHDASEAYLRDLASPVKALPGMREVYGAIEAQLMGVILEKFGVSKGIFDEEIPKETADAIVHWADMYALTVEAYHFMPSRGLGWSTFQKLSMQELQNFVQPLPPMEIYDRFLSRLDELLV